MEYGRWIVVHIKRTCGNVLGGSLDDDRRSRLSSFLMADTESNILVKRLYHPSAVKIHAGQIQGDLLTPAIKKSQIRFFTMQWKELSQECFHHIYIQVPMFQGRERSL